MTGSPAAPLPDGYTDVAAGRIAAIATTLEMRAPTPPRSLPPLHEGLTIRKIDRPDPAWYRRLFRTIGEPWLWHSRLRLSEAALAAILCDDDVAVWALAAIDPGGELVSDEGMLELDFRKPGACELAFFGLVPSLTGRGLGRHLMARAVSEAWRRPIERFWVHTCTLDHPSSLGFYMRSGFIPVKRQVEIAFDPRLDGTLSPDAAPDVPIIPLLEK